jgi:PHD/YefM family antitoxin component YafN of YafNO toxin-antitoxin module
MVQKTIDAAELQNGVAAVLDDVAQQHTTYILSRDSHPEAVLIPYDQFLHYRELDRQGVDERFNEMLDRLDALNAGYSEEEIAAAVAEVRAEKRR